jgi:predicted nuclease of predicted toxin-antitoxin system
MRFLVDECTGPGVAKWLRDQHHDVFSAYEGAQGTADEVLLQRACAENRILVTNDKDFGEMVFRDKLPHRGIIFLRLDDQRTPNKIAVLEKILLNYPDELTDRFVVATEKVVRIVGNS